MHDNMNTTWAQRRTNLLPTVRLDDVLAPQTAKQESEAMRRILPAAIDGECTLDEAAKAMILTKTLWCVELEWACMAKLAPDEV